MNKADQKKKKSQQTIDGRIFADQGGLIVGGAGAVGNLTWVKLTLAAASRTSHR